MMAPASDNGVVALRSSPSPASPAPAAAAAEGSISSDSCTSAPWEMTPEEFKRQVQNNFSVTLSIDEVKALQRLHGVGRRGGSSNGGVNGDNSKDDANSGGGGRISSSGGEGGKIDFLAFTDSLNKTPTFGLDKSRKRYNFLPQSDAVPDYSYALKKVEDQICAKLETLCQVQGNYKYQMAYKMLCDANHNLYGGLNKQELKERISSLLGTELTERETTELFNKYKRPDVDRVNIKDMVRMLLQSYDSGGWFFLAAQYKEPIVYNRISDSARFPHHHGTGHRDPVPQSSEFPRSLNGFRWNIDKLASKLRTKINEHAQGHAGYQYLEACKIFRRELPHRVNDLISCAEFRDIVRKKFGMEVELREVAQLFEIFKPGCGGAAEICELMRSLVPPAYGESWFSSRESTDMPGFQQNVPEKVVLQIDDRKDRHAWSIDMIEDKVRLKIRERTGAAGNFELQSAYKLFGDCANEGSLSRQSFKRQMHDKFSVVLSDQELDVLFKKYDTDYTGSLNLREFLTRLLSRTHEVDPWFHGRETYEFWVKNNAPLKKDLMDAPSWKGQAGKWDMERFEQELKHKIMCKSKEDNGSYAFKSAINLLRSANPSPQNASFLNRDGLRFVMFRRFDIVMEPQLEEELFKKYDPDSTGYISIHYLVRCLLPPAADGSHHLVPKTDAQSVATKTLLGKIFNMTGHRREIMSLNGSGVENPQPTVDLKGAADAARMGGGVPRKGCGVGTTTTSITTTTTTTASDTLPPSSTSTVSPTGTTIAIGVETAIGPGSRSDSGSGGGSGDTIPRYMMATAATNAAAGYEGGAYAGTNAIPDYQKQRQARMTLPPSSREYNIVSGRPSTATSSCNGKNGYDGYYTAGKQLPIMGSRQPLIDEAWLVQFKRRASNIDVAVIHGDGDDIKQQQQQQQQQQQPQQGQDLCCSCICGSQNCKNGATNTNHPLIPTRPDTNRDMSSAAPAVVATATTTQATTTKQQRHTGSDSRKGGGGGGAPPRPAQYSRHERMIAQGKGNGDSHNLSRPQTSASTASGYQRATISSAASCTGSASSSPPSPAVHHRSQSFLPKEQKMIQELIQRQTATRKAQLEREHQRAVQKQEQPRSARLAGAKFESRYSDAVNKAILESSDNAFRHHGFASGVVSSRYGSGVMAG